MIGLGWIASAWVTPGAEMSGPATDASNPAQERVAVGSQLSSFLSSYCVSCHGAENPKAGVNFAAAGVVSRLVEHRKFWERVREVLLRREMPPENKPQPAEEERLQAAQFIRTTLDKFDCVGAVNPGRVTLRRLNRAEYRNTIRDLVGVEFNPAADFPADEVGYGFDNIGDVLSLSPMLLEKYLAAAEQIGLQAIPRQRSAQSPQEVQARIFVCDPGHEHTGECAEQAVRRFARRAWRRPVTDAEVRRLVRFVEVIGSEGGAIADGVRLAVQAMLASPQFLFRWELDPESTGPEGVRSLNDYELASRLSYFLWSSMPDEALLVLAEEGALTKAGVLEAQVRRMLGDSKARALVENFGGQWLQVRNLAGATPDPGLFPGFDETLRAAMRAETELFFEAILKEDRSILEFIESDFTFLNERLARHYGLAGVEGDAFRRVQLDPGSVRGGVLTHASVLTITSNPTRTSPVNRGKWILEQVLGAAPPPPPPNVPELKNDAAAIQGASLRQRMELHRAKPECAICHTKMDALGFALENFDAVGAWREQDGKFSIDAAGVLPDGRAFSGPAELKRILKSENAFVRCLAEKMLTYALGRGLEYYDKCAVDDICAALVAQKYRFSSLVIAIVKSEPFRKKNVGSTTTTAALSQP